MKKVILAFCSVLASFNLFSQCDISTSNAQSVPATIAVNGVSELRFTVTNAAPNADCVYPINSIRLVFSFPGITYKFEEVKNLVDNKGPLFTWTYDYTEDVLIGVNHTTISSADVENVAVKVSGTTVGNTIAPLNTEVYGGATNSSVGNDPLLFRLIVEQAAAPLPVRLLSFTAENKGEFNKIDWSSTDFKNFSHFELQRSFDGKEFKALSKVNATKTGNSVEKYSFNDTDIASVRSINYRLKLIDADGTYSFSKIVTLENTQIGLIVSEALPNPMVGQFANFTIDSPSASVATVEILNASGLKLTKSNIDLTKGLNDVKVKAPMGTSGVLLFKFVQNGKTITKKVVKQ
jgi:hypothetical protein